jgi:uncharacterized membrane-anchored protein YitT (DUF2179 family)
MKKRLGKEIRQYALIIIGLLACALAYRMFLIPNEVAPGGFTGVGQLLNSLFGWSVGWVTLALNIPLFLMSARSLGLDFGVRSLVATIGLSLLLDYLPVPAVTSDRMLASVFGGVLGGAGFGLILRGNATTGGTDMLAKLVHGRFPMIKVSVVLFAVDALVIFASGLVFDATAAMFALISSFLMSKMVDTVLEGMNAAKAYFIISAKSDEIARRIMYELERGVTALDGRGMYSGAERHVLLCVVSRMETIRLRTIVAEEDSQAFVIAADAHEVLGEGFSPHTKVTAHAKNRSNP